MEGGFVLIQFLEEGVTRQSFKGSLLYRDKGFCISNEVLQLTKNLFIPDLKVEFKDLQLVG